MVRGDAIESVHPHPTLEAASVTVSSLVDIARDSSYRGVPADGVYILTLLGPGV
jgi:hypothetical protein